MLGCPGSLMSLYRPTFHATPIDLGIIFHCKIYCIYPVPCVMEINLFQTCFIHRRALYMCTDRHLGARTDIGLNILISEVGWCVLFEHPGSTGSTATTRRIRFVSKGWRYKGYYACTMIHIWHSRSRSVHIDCC